MKKKILSALLAIFLLFCVASCSKTANDPEDTKVPVSSGGGDTAKDFVQTDKAEPQGGINVPDIPPQSTQEQQEPSVQLANPEGANRWEKLPDVSDCELSDSLMLWDFLNGTLGWHVDTHQDEFFSDCYLVCNRKNPDAVYYDRYTYVEPALPMFGTGIVEVYLTAEELDAVHAAMNKVPDERVIQDGDWTLYLLIHDGGYGQDVHDPMEACITYYDSTGQIKEAHEGLVSTNGQKMDCFGGVPSSRFDSEPTVEHTLQDTPYHTGEGVASEWIRKQPWADAMLKQGIDATDIFWDSWTYAKQYPVYAIDGDEFQGYVIPVGTKKFSIEIADYLSGVDELTLSSEELYMMLDADGLYIPDMMNMF